MSVLAGNSDVLSEADHSAEQSPGRSGSSTWHSVPQLPDSDAVRRVALGSDWVRSESR